MTGGQAADTSFAAMHRMVMRDKEPLLLVCADTQDHPETVGRLAGVMRDSMRAALAGGRAFDLGHRPQIDDASAEMANREMLSGEARHPFVAPYVLSYVERYVPPGHDGAGAPGAIDERVMVYVMPDGAELNTASLAVFVTAPLNGRDRLYMAAAGEIALLDGSDPVIGVKTLDVGFPPDGETIAAITRMLGMQCDMLRTMHCLLSRPNIVQRRIAPAPASAKNRRLLGRPPLPTYTALLPADGYRTLLDATRASLPTGPHGGTHASPVEHLRRGHYRERNGQRFWVRPTVVNPGHVGPRSRSHYLVRATGSTQTGSAR